MFKNSLAFVLGKLPVWASAIALATMPFVANAQSVEPLDPPQAVKVAYVPIMKFATMYVAEQRGLFDKYGLNVDLERV